MKDILKVNKNSLSNAGESLEKFETIESLNAIKLLIANVYKSYSKLNSDVEENMKLMVESYSADDTCNLFSIIFV